MSAFFHITDISELDTVLGMVSWMAVGDTITLQSDLNWMEIRKEWAKDERENAITPCFIRFVYPINHAISYPAYDFPTDRLVGDKVFLAVRHSLNAFLLEEET